MYKGFFTETSDMRWGRPKTKYAFLGMTSFSFYYNNEYVAL